MSENRVFSEQEVAAIIQRAIELSEQEDQAYQPGITREELFKIAADVGVPNEAIQRVLREQQASKDPPPRVQFTQIFERVVDGELDPGQYDLIIEGLKPMSQHHPSGASQVGRTLTMSTWNGYGQSIVELTSRRGRTRVKVKSNAFLQGLMSLYPAFMGSLISMGILAENGNPALGVAVGVTLMGAGTAIFRWLTRRGHEKSQAMADTLRNRVEEALAEQNSPPTTATTAETPLEQRLGG